MTAARDATAQAIWRAMVQEPAIAPDLPIIDAHHHIFPTSPYPHFHAYPVDELERDKRDCGHRIVATVFVEAGVGYDTNAPVPLQSIGETRIAARAGREADAKGGDSAGLCAGIVAHADLMLGDAVEAVLDAQAEAAQGRLRGVRCMLANDPEVALGTVPDMLADSRLRAASAHLMAQDLVLDAWLLHPQLPALAELAAACPHLTIVLDHMGTPLGTGRYATCRDRAFVEWREGMARLAQLPNLMVKLGGLNMAQTGLGARDDATAPWPSSRMADMQRRHLLETIDLFGTHRCMFESNFPVDRMATGATALWNSFKRVVADFSAAEQSNLFHDTAARVYRIGA